jgi:hypothetical protein
MRPEAVLYQHPWFLVSPFFGLGIKHTLKPDSERAYNHLGVGYVVQLFL